MASSKHRYVPCQVCESSLHQRMKQDPASWSACTYIGVMAVDPEAGWFAEGRNCVCGSTLWHDVPASAVEESRDGTWHTVSGFRWTRANINYQFEE